MGDDEPLLGRPVFNFEPKLLSSELKVEDYDDLKGNCDEVQEKFD